MRKLFTVLAALLLTISVFAQTPQKMSYQAVIRNASNVLITSAHVGMKISILQGSATGSEVYIETQNPSTNANGLVSLEIGTGTVVTGTFAAINWATGPYFIKTETDPTGGTAYTITGFNELMSVPYALFSANSTPGPQGPIGNTGAIGPQGAQGTQGLTGPAGNSPIITFAAGSSSLKADNSTLNYTVVPGLSVNITIPTLSIHKVLIQTDGGVQINSSNSTAIGFTDVAIFINGVQAGAGRRVPAINNGSVQYAVNAYSFSTLSTLSGGTYTIEVRAKKFSNIFTDCYVSSSADGSTLVGNPPLQGILNIMQFP
jgi:hypothetical protein